MKHDKQDNNLNTRGANMINAATMKVYHQHPSKLILKYANVLSQSIESHNVHLYKIAPYKKCKVLKYTYVQ